MKNRIPNIINDWCNTIAERNAIKQTGFYADNAILLATYEPILIGKKEIYNYFSDLLKKKGISCEITENYSLIKGDTLVSSGLYTFSFEENNKRIYVPARYTFVIYKNKIWDHHSSEEPIKK
jgi:hypothetical protein